MAAPASPSTRTDWQRLLRFARRLLLFLVPLGLLAAAGVAWVDAQNRGRVCTRNMREKLAAFPDSGAERRLLVLGDSRAEFNVDPRVLSRELGVGAGSCVNLAVAGGDPSTAVKALRVRPDLLRGEPTILLSASISHLHDGAGYYTEDLLADVSFLERLDWLGPGRLASYYVDAVEQLVGLQQTRPTTPGIWGYRPRTGSAQAFTDAEFARTLRDLQWYRDVRFAGVRARVLGDHLRWLASLGQPVLVYEGPLAPAWRAYVVGSEVERADREFTRTLRSLCTQAGVAFESFRDRPGLADEDFLDWLHLNEEGAATFSAWLAAAVRALPR